MRITNPFIDNAPTDLEDRALVARARSGDRKALEDLVQRHQAWIYNIAVRMLYHPQDAEDAILQVSRGVVGEGVRGAHGSSFRVIGPQLDRSNGVQAQHPATPRAVTQEA